MRAQFEGPFSVKLFFFWNFFFFFGVFQRVGQGVSSRRWSRTSVKVSPFEAGPLSPYVLDPLVKQRPLWSVTRSARSLDPHLPSPERYFGSALADPSMRPIL